MKHGTCLFCDHAFVAKSKARKFCHDCLPERLGNSLDRSAQDLAAREYMRRYMVLRDACWAGGPNATCSIAHLHAKVVDATPAPVMHGPPAPNTCEQCGATHWHGPKFCSRLCSRRAHNATESARAMKRLRKQRARARKIMDWRCEDCGCPTPQGSRRCIPHADEYRQRKAAEYLERNRDAMRAAHARYRALKRKAMVERFLHVEIFERDGWLCQLCGLPIDRDAAWPHPMSVSLDHIVPLSLGGAHSRANTQCAHISCNIGKSNRYDGYQQMALEVA